MLLSGRPGCPLADLQYSGEKVDMYTLGVILFEMLIQIHPFSWYFEEHPEFEDLDYLMANIMVVVQLRHDVHQTLVDKLMQRDFQFSEVILSPAQLSLLCAMLHPLPAARPTIQQVLASPWLSQPCIDQATICEDLAGLERLREQERLKRMPASDPEDGRSVRRASSDDTDRSGSPAADDAPADCDLALPEWMGNGAFCSAYLLESVFVSLDMDWQVLKEALQDVFTVRDIVVMTCDGNGDAPQMATATFTFRTRPMVWTITPYRDPKAMATRRLLHVECTKGTSRDFRAVWSTVSSRFALQPLELVPRFRDCMSTVSATGTPQAAIATVDLSAIYGVADAASTQQSDDKP